MKKAVLLDLDGTLWDSSENVMKAWNHVLKQNGLIEKTREDCQAVMGLAMDEIAERFFKELGSPKKEEMMAQCENYENKYLEKHGGILFENVIDMLKELHKKYFVAIVSNCQDGYIQAFMKHYQIEDLIDDFESYGKTLKYKDENIKEVIQRNHIDKAVYVGDIINDYNAAKSAGVPFIFASYGFGDVENTPKVKSCGEIPVIADKVLNEN